MLAFVVLTVAAYAVAPADASASRDPDIVIIGERINDARGKLAACLARHCSPKEDIDATLALAEVQLLEGDYDHARQTLQESIRRNRNAGDEFALPLSDLYRANGRVAAHLGIDSDYYRSAYSAYDAVKRGTSDGDYRRFMARIDIAEMLAETHDHEWARNYYEDIAREARKAGRPDIATLAELRSFIRHYPEGPDRTKGIERIAAMTDPNLRAAVLEAKLALARGAYEKGDPALGDEIVHELADLKIKNPILVYAPPFQLTQEEPPNGSMFDVKLNAGGAGGGYSITHNLPTGRWSITNRIPEQVDDMWIDVTFQIAADGTVRNAKIARSRGELYWTKPLMKSIEGRRYTPAVEGSPQSFRKERYTYTAALQKQSGTKMVGRSPKARIEYLDLSPSGLTRAD